MPQRSASQAWSSADVTGVMRSTIEFGNEQFSSTHRASDSLRAAAAVSVA